MKAGLYQFNPSFGEKEKNLEEVMSAVKDADVELLVLPEFFATGYQFASAEDVTELSEPVPNGRTTEMLADLSRGEASIRVVASLAGFRSDPETDSAYQPGSP